MLKHKQYVFAAIAVTALIGYVAPPAAQLQIAQAQVDTQGIIDKTLEGVFGGDDEEVAATDAGGGSGDDDQEIDQDASNEAEVENEIDQESDQSETNVQANDLTTGDNTATVTQSNDADQTVAAEATAAAESLTSGGCCDNDDDHDKHKKHHSSDSGSDSGGTSSETEAEANAAAEGTQDNDNIAAVDQTSEIHDVDLSNNVAFGDDTNEQVAIPIIDQDQTADQRAANLDLDIDEEYGFTTGGGGGGGGDNDGVRQCFEDNQGFGPIRECIRGL
jgi:hypothetical protein